MAEVFNGNYSDSNGNILNIDGDPVSDNNMTLLKGIYLNSNGEIVYFNGENVEDYLLGYQDGMSPFNGNYLDSKGQIRNIDELLELDAAIKALPGRVTSLEELVELLDTTKIEVNIAAIAANAEAITTNAQHIAQLTALEDLVPRMDAAEDDIDELAARLANNEDLANENKEALEDLELSGGYVLPEATEDTLGGIKLGEDFTLDENGYLHFVGQSGTDYVLPKATANTLGGVKIGAGVSVNAEGEISVTPPPDISGKVDKEEGKGLAAARSYVTSVGNLTIESDKIAIRISKHNVTDSGLTGGSTGYVTLPVAEPNFAGLLSAADKVKVDKLPLIITYDGEMGLDDFLVGSYVFGAAPILSGAPVQQAAIGDTLEVTAAGTQIYTQVDTQRKWIRSVGGGGV